MSIKHSIIIWLALFASGFAFCNWIGSTNKKKGKYGLTEHTQDVKAARELYDSAVFYKADRDEQMQRRMVAEQQNAQLKQQLQQYQAAVEKINDRLKKAKDITPPATNTNSPTVSTNQAAKEGK